MVIKGEKRRDVGLGRLCCVRLCYVMCLVGFVGLVGLVRLCYVMLRCVVVCYSNVGRRGVMPV